METIPEYTAPGGPLPAGEVTREFSIDGRRVTVIDRVFTQDEVSALYGLLEALPYRLNDYDVEETAYSRHWKSELPAAMVAGNALFRRGLALATAWARPARIELARVHANLHLYGDMQFPHTDVAGGTTLLYYANPAWDEKWLGETVFYDDAREPVHVVAPRPGRVVIFEADTLHRAGVPSRECFQPRISLAFKFRAAGSSSAD